MKQFEAGEVLKDTLQHPEDVKKHVYVLSRLLQNKSELHDLDKLHNPNDVLDLIKMIVDCVCACHRRNADGLEGYQPIDVSKLDLEKIIRNTEKMVKDIINLDTVVSHFLGLADGTVDEGG